MGKNKEEPCHKLSKCVENCSREVTNPDSYESKTF